MGHEGMGYVQEIGNAVRHISVGDFVVIPGATDSGHLEMDGPELGNGYGLGRTWGDADGIGCQGTFSSQVFMRLPQFACIAPVVRSLR